MTDRQQQEYARLVAKVKKAYTAMKENTDKSKQEQLSLAWVKATEKADAYMVRYL